MNRYLATKKVKSTLSLKKTSALLSKVQIIILAGSIIQIPMLFLNLSEADSFRFAQTTLVVKQFMSFGFDPRMPLPIFGANSFLPFEFPIFQGVAALLGSVFNTSPLFAARLAAIIFFQISALFIYLISKKLFIRRVAVITLILFEFSPFGLRYAHSPLIEFAAVSLMLIAIYLFILYFDEQLLRLKAIYFMGALSALVLGYLAKVTTGVALTPLLLLPLFSIRSEKFSSKEVFNKIFPIGISLSISLLIVAFWTRYSDQVKEMNPITSHLVSTLPHMKAWTVGNLKDRFDVVAWETILLKYLGPISGGFLILLLLGFFAYNSQRKLLISLLFFTIIFPMVIFINLYKNHQYYVSAIFSILVLLCALGINGIVIYFEPVKSKVFVTVFILLLLFSSATSRYGLNYFADILHHSQPPALVSEIKSVVPENSYIMYLGCDWNLEIPFYIESKILIVPEWGIRPNQSDLNQVQYVAFCSLFPQDQDLSLDKYFPEIDTANKLSPNVIMIR